MAITTLPYPNMDFVPLDILTASELDEIVANVEAINASSINTAALSNLAVTTAKIADGAVTASKFGSDTTAVKRTELFSGNSNSNVTLSSAVTNFDAIEITYQDNNTTPNAEIKTIPSSAGAVALYIAHAGGSSTLYLNASRWTISGSTMTKSSNSYEKAFASTSFTTSTASHIYITKVVGIKYTQN